MIRRLALAAVCLSILACGNSNTAPTSATVNLSGTWTGSTTDSLAGVGTLRFTLAQSGSSVTGSFASQYQAGAGGGSFAGAVAGTALSGTTTPSVPTLCPSTVTATVNGSTMTGTFAAFNCTVAETGSFTVTKS